MFSSIPFEISIARRFLTENRGQTLMIVLGISLGVAVMVFLTALIDGLQADLIEKTVGQSPHIVITDADFASADAVAGVGGISTLVVDISQKTSQPIVDWRNITKTLSKDRRIEAVVPVAEGSGLVMKGQVNRSVLVKGVELEQADLIYKISDSIIAGSPNLSGGAVLLGKDLAEDLNISAGDPIVVGLSGREPITVMVDGIFDVGVSAVNNRWLVMDRHRAGVLLGIGDRVNAIELQVDDVLDAENMAEQWRGRLPDVGMETWQQSNASLLAGLRSQSTSSYTIQFFVLLAVTLGVASVLAISAVQKSRQIGILKAIGIRTKSVARVFMFQGLFLGILGTALGFGIGLGISEAFISLAEQEYALVLKPSTSAIITVATVTAAALSAYIPARKVSRINPMEIIRNG